MKITRTVSAMTILFLIVVQSMGCEASGSIPRPHFADQKIGFWLPLNGLAFTYSEDQFFDAYFLKPPYPAFVEFISAQDWDTTEYGGWVKGVALKAVQYPEIEISVMLAWDFDQDGQWKNVQEFLDNVKNISSIKYVGVEGEHSRSLGATDEAVQANYDRAKLMVEKAGFTFVSYYLRGSKSVTSKYLEIGHTNYPCDDANYTLDWHTSEQFIGQSAGLFEDHSFPNNRTLFPWHWTQSTIHEVIDTGASKTPDQRHVIVFVAGHSTARFVGVSGKTTTHLWDNPLFRKWIWERQQLYPMISRTTPPSNTTSTSMSTSTTSTSTSTSTSTYTSSTRTSTSTPTTSTPTSTGTSTSTSATSVPTSTSATSTSTSISTSTSYTSTRTSTRTDPPPVLDPVTVSYATFIVLVIACVGILSTFVRRRRADAPAATQLAGSFLSVSTSEI